MHYVRFLRAPTLRPAPRGGTLDLVLTLTNDLGENLLNLQRPLELAVTLHQQPYDGGEEKVTALSTKGQVVWKPGSRVIKTTITLSGVVYANLGEESWLQVSPAVKTVVADGARKIMGAVEGRGLIMPAWHLVSREDGEGEASQVVYRRLQLGERAEVMIGEEIKDSIARHVWDGGVMALCAIAEAMTGQASEVGSTMGMLRDLVRKEETRTILELGCGIGTLGIGLASLCDGFNEDVDGKEILMTDLEDAEEIVEVNLKGFEGRRRAHEEEEQSARRSEIGYENLDWMDARHGTFNAKTAASAWDLIILSDCTYNEDTLSALVDTLSAIHEHNVKIREEEEGGGGGGRKQATKLFLATKHRHESEMEAFALLRAAGWVMLSDQTKELPFLEGESQKVQMCIFEKI